MSSTILAAIDPARTVTRWVQKQAGWWLRCAADRVDRPHAPRATQWSFTVEPGYGARLRVDGHGCRLWYLSDDDHQRAYTDSDTARGATGSTADPDRACPHRSYAIDTEMCAWSANGDGPERVALITITCADCREPFRVTGVTHSTAASPHHPTCSPDERILALPIRPAGHDPDHGLSTSGPAGCDGFLW